MRFGTSMTRRIRPRFLRMRKLDWIAVAIVAPLALTGARVASATRGSDTERQRYEAIATADQRCRARTKSRRARPSASNVGTRNAGRGERRDLSPRRRPHGDQITASGTASTYLSSTLAPASSSFFLMSSASALATPSLTVLGAPSTRSFASLRPRPVISRTTLMTLILFAPASVRTTVNSVFSSAAAAAAAGSAAGPRDGDRSGLDAPLVFEVLDELRDLDDREVREVVDDLVLA